MLFLLIITGSIVKAEEGPKANSGSSISQSQTDIDVEPIHGKVIKVYSDNIKTSKSAERYSNVDVKILSSKLKGKIPTVQNFVNGRIKEIKEARPDITKKELIKSGMNVGKDIMGTMANTLILAYAGGAMHIMIMIASYTTSMSTAINQDIIAAEILKALAGSIGLIFAIPITAIVSAILTTNNESKVEKIKVFKHL